MLDNGNISASAAQGQTKDLATGRPKKKREQGQNTIRAILGKFELSPFIKFKAIEFKGAEPALSIAPEIIKLILAPHTCYKFKNEKPA